MNKKIIAVIGVVVLAVGAFALMPKNSSKNEVEAVAPVEYKVPVSVEKTSVMDMSKYVYSIGDVSSDDIYTVTSKIQGEVESINFKVGDSVKKGDVLFRLKSTDFVVDKNSNLMQMQNQLETAKFANDDALTAYNNTKALYESGSVSKREFDLASTQYENAKNNYDSLQRQYNNTANTYKVNQDNFTIKSPTSGIVTKVNMSLGMNISSQNSFEIESSSKKIFNTTISTSEISSIEIGQRADIYISTIDKNITGLVREISYSGVNGSYPVTIELDDQNDIFTGMYGEVKIEVLNKKGILALKDKSIVVEGDSNYVYIIRDNIAYKQEVKTGIKDQNMIEITEGITSEDNVVVLGKEYLSENSEVVISE